MALEGRRQSASHEVGLFSEAEALAPFPSKRERPQSVRFRSKDEIHVVERYHDDNVLKEAGESIGIESRQRPQHTRPDQSPSPDGFQSMMYRLGACLLLLAAAVPLIQSASLSGRGSVLPVHGVSGGPIPAETRVRREINLEKRADSRTDVCLRWAQQCSLRCNPNIARGSGLTTFSCRRQWHSLHVRRSSNHRVWANRKHLDK